MKRIVDRGAISAAYVGIGMAVTIVASFLLIIPIEGLIWLFALPSGLLIGYYANQRSNRRAGPWRRILSNGLFAGLATGLAMAVLLLVIKSLFFYADNGYRDPGLGGQISCATGADCVYQRYLDAGRGPEFLAAGVSDASSFTALYWREQFGSGGTVFGLTVLGSLGGAALYGLFRPRPVTAETIVPA
ncbi:MAG: hypothetical protein QOJ75_1560 [Chloroflexota bacterium]|nr:hypothetical protein [Chloroflexota bacterium]